MAASVSSGTTRHTFSGDRAIPATRVTKVVLENIIGKRDEGAHMILKTKALTPFSPPRDRKVGWGRKSA